jgi:hypothetical protein
MPQYAPRSARRHVRAGELLTIPICPSLRGWPAPGTAALSGFLPTARDVAGSRSRPSQDLPACPAARTWFAGRAGQARTADSNGGSNPTPATTSENGPHAAETRPSGPFPSCHAMYRRVSLRVDVAQWLRTYGVQRTAGRSGAYNSSLCRSAPVLSRYPGARAARLTDVPDTPAGRFGSSPSCSRWAAGWPCSCLRPGRAAGSARAMPSRLLLRRWPSARRCRWDGRPVGFQNSATDADLGFYATRSYSLMKPPRTGRRWIRSWERSAAGWSGRGGWSWRLRWGRRPL